MAMVHIPPPPRAPHPHPVGDESEEGGIGSDDRTEPTQQSPDKALQGKRRPEGPSRTGTQGARSDRRIPGGRRTKASIKIASLNLRGHGTIHDTAGKWGAVNQTMREKGIGILAIQEAHLDDAGVNLIHDLYGRWLRVHHSADPNNPTGARGVAVVLNREIVDIANVVATEVIPGRAILVRLRWHREKTLTVLNVYAPNATTKNTVFWSTLQESRAINRTPPEVILGDFNIVESLIDRLPMREDPAPAILALQAFISEMQVVDGWRNTEPTTVNFTFPQQDGGMRSRLDRIYTSNDLLLCSTEWNIEHTAIPTDHRIVSARISCRESPFIGKGRWTIPLQLIHDHTFIKALASLGEKALTTAQKSDQEGGRTDQNNAQLALHQFKREARTLARNTLKRKTPKIQAAIASLKREIAQKQNDPGFPANVAVQQEVAQLEAHLLSLEQRRHGQVQLSTSTHYALNQERITKYWSAVNKEKKPRDLFYMLRQPNSGSVASRSDEMAQLARNYHEALQTVDVDTSQPTEERKEDIAAALNGVHTPLDKADADFVASPVTKDEVKDALKQAGCGKAAGLDGIPYEMWKALDEKFKRTPKDASPRFDCLELLFLAYKDMETHGTSDQTGFSEGWICPLYKKKDRRNIANYRPITLLNSDYKLYTKIQATRLSRIAHHIIHPDQAGFIPR